MPDLPGSDADLVIAGAGASGLSALWYVLHEGPPLGRIVVVDRDLTPGDDRTWAFWGSADAPFAHLADRAWDRLAVRFPRWHLEHQLRPGRRYWRVRRRDYDTAILDLAAGAPNVELVTADVVDVADEPGRGVVRTSVGDLRAPVVFQSVRPAPGDAAAPVRHPLRQHFGGWEVRTEQPVFTPDVATFMDFATDQHDGLAFFYVLPEAADRALVEHTVFSPTPRDHAFYDDHLAAHLAERGAGAIEIERREYGVIPMEERVLHPTWGGHVHNIGSVGGRVKASTGYAFGRIHAQTRHLARTWAAGGTPEPLPGPPRRYPLNDRLLLHVLHRQPSEALPVFEALFRSMSVDDVLTFLDEDSTVRADLSMMARMPWAPFLRAVGAETAAAVAARVGATR